MVQVRRSNVITFLLLALLGLARLGEAQMVRGFVSGTVTDATDAIIAGVQVTITNKATNISRDTVTNDAGFYRFVAVEPADYSVAFSLSGFETHKIDTVTVRTAQEIVINQTLKVSDS